MTPTHPPEDSWYCLHLDDGRSLARVRAEDATHAVTLGCLRDGIPDRYTVHARRLPEAIALWLDDRPDADSRPFVTSWYGDSQAIPEPIDEEELGTLLGGCTESTYHGNRGVLDISGWVESTYPGVRGILDNISRDWCHARGLASGNSRYLRIAWGVRLTWGSLAEGAGSARPRGSLS